MKQNRALCVYLVLALLFSSCAYRVPLSQVDLALEAGFSLPQKSEDLIVYFDPSIQDEIMVRPGNFFTGGVHRFYYPTGRVLRENLTQILDDIYSDVQVVQSKPQDISTGSQLMIFSQTKQEIQARSKGYGLAYLCPLLLFFIKQEAWTKYKSGIKMEIYKPGNELLLAREFSSEKESLETIPKTGTKRRLDLYAVSVKEVLSDLIMQVVKAL